MHTITQIKLLTADQLREQGALAADRGEGIYEAEIRSGLDGDSLLIFEAGYFERQFELKKSNPVLQDLWGRIGDVNPV